MKKLVVILCLVLFIHISAIAQGLVFEQVRIPERNKITNVAFNGECYVAVGENGILMASTTLSDWVEIKGLTYRNVENIAWNGREFVAISADYILKSSDGINWSRSINKGFSGRILKWAGDKWIAGRNDGAFIAQFCTTTVL